MYNPFDWYWVADDGRIFSSKRQIVVDSTDADYIAWTWPGTPWPTDDAGEQTDAALQAVLAPYHTVFVNLAYYAEHKRRERELRGLTLSSGMPIETDERTLARAVALRAMAKDDPEFTTQWHAADGNVHPLDGEAIISLSNELIGHINDCQNIAADVLAKIASRSITTQEQVNSAFA